MAAPMERMVSRSIFATCKRCAATTQIFKRFPVQYTRSYSTPSHAYAQKEFFRCRENNPANHTESHVGQFYTIPLDEVPSFTAGVYSKKWHRLIKPFGEAGVMVRKPAVEIISYMKQTNFDHPPLKYVIFGRRGSGKTMTMNHVMHYCHNEGWMIIQVPFANWFNFGNKFNYLDSVSNEGMYDQPAFAVEMLKLIKLRNEKYLTELETHNKYVWSKREQTEAGEPLMAVVEQGINRPKNSGDAIGVIFKELKLHSHDGKYKLLVAIRAVNGLFLEQTAIRKFGGYKIPVNEMTLHMHYKNLLRGNWINGAILTTIDENQVYGKEIDSFKPMAHLGKEGFDIFDPFIPIHVPDYSEKEYESQMAYFMHHNWIQEEEARTEAGRKHIKVLSEMNPAEVDRIVAPI